MIERILKRLGYVKRGPAKDHVISTLSINVETNTGIVIEDLERLEEILDRINEKAESLVGLAAIIYDRVGDIEKVSVSEQKDE